MFTAVFARVVLGQLILVELLELVGHCLLQARRQGATEALQTHTHTRGEGRGGVMTGTEPTRPHAPAETHRAVDPDDLQPVRGQLNGGAEVSAHVWLGGGQIGGQGQQEVCCDADVELLSSVNRHLNGRKDRTTDEMMMMINSS